MIGVLLLGVTTLIVITGPENPTRIIDLMPKALIDVISINPGISFISALILLSIKTILSFLLTRHLLNLTAKIQLFFGTKTFKKVLTPKPSLALYKNDKKISQMITDGSRAAASGIIAYVSLSITEFALLVLLVTPLVIFMPQLMFFLFVTIGMTSYYAQNKIGKYALYIGDIKSSNENKLRNHTNEINALSKFLLVSKKYKSLIKANTIIADLAAKANSRVHLAQQLPKFFLELNLILAMVVMCTYFYFNTSLEQAIANVVVIMSVSSRILPTILRLQGAIIFAKSNVIETEELFDYLEYTDLNFSSHTKRQIILHSCIDPYCRHLPEIHFEKVSYRYFDSSEIIIENLTFSVKSGEMLVLKGRSGTGKTTIADLILGIAIPNEGKITIECCSKCDLKMAYMPQETHLIEGSIIENIAIGELAASEKDVLRVLELSGATSFISNLGAKLEEKIGLGERKLSGGQKQRIGLARALYLNPNLLILDEPTSSLDSYSSQQLFDTLLTLQNDMTMIMIAHNTNEFKNSVRLMEI
jgi:ABC-type multidrug transport system fused ATPase/permease subunit